MTSRPDAFAVRHLLARAARRLAWRDAARGAAVGLVVALIVAAIARHASPRTLLLTAALGALGAAVWVWATRVARRNVARVVEQRAPGCRNLIVTADELFASGATGYVPDLVLRDAARAASALDLGELLPLYGALAAFAAALAIWIGGVAIIAAPAASRLAPLRAALGRGAPTVGRVDVQVTPPAYAARPNATLRDPARVEALAGSALRLDVNSPADRIVVETVRRRDTLRAARTGYFTALVQADADGYVALEPLSADGTAGVRRLIGLTVVPDAPPSVRITAPGRDVFLKDGSGTLDLAVDASDDIGLSALRLRYTKVSGSGERFAFTEGDVPLAITRRDGQHWTARATWPLSPLALDAGDMVVYRAVAADARPGAPAVESDSYIAEVVAPGGVAAAGFSTDPEQERYAVSQQMVILKTERLLAKRAAVTPAAFTEEAQEIAVEQRKVRAEFVFMLGGELVDAPDISSSITDLNEQAEAEGEGDLLAGHNANAGHVALLRAIRAMSRASTSLNVGDAVTALPQEHAALTQLESAFSRARIILRALSERERLDFSRRLTGALTDASRDTRPVTTPEADPVELGLRRVLASIAAIEGSAGDRDVSATAAPRIADFAQTVLQIDPAHAALQSASAALSSAAVAARDGRADRARADLDRATTIIAGIFRGSASGDGALTPDAGSRLLEGALRDALRDGQRTRRGAP